MKFHLNDFTAIVITIVLVYFLSFSLSDGKAQYQGETRKEPENDNMTSRDAAVYDQTNVPSDNQTMRATNVINGTSANGTTANILNNSLQQQLQTPLQSPPSLQQQQLPPIMQSPQQPICCYYPNYNPKCVSGQTIQIAIAPKAAKLNQAF